MDIIAQFFACFSQKLAPTRKNSTDWSARSARFCNSDFKDRAYTHSHPVQNFYSIGQTSHGLFKFEQKYDWSHALLICFMYDCNTFHTFCSFRFPRGTFFLGRFFCLSCLNVRTLTPILLFIIMVYQKGKDL